MVMTATKHPGNDGNGKDEEDSDDSDNNRVTFNDGTISYKRGWWWRGLEADTVNKRRRWWQERDSSTDLATNKRRQRTKEMAVVGKR